MTQKKVNAAVKLFKDFTGENPTNLNKHKKPVFPDVALYVGECTGIMYEAVRDGKTENYIHEFKEGSQPMLISSHDGKQLFLLGGKYQFKDDGINDR